MGIEMEPTNILVYDGKGGMKPLNEACWNIDKTKKVTIYLNPALPSGTLSVRQGDTTRTFPPAQWMWRGEKNSLAEAVLRLSREMEETV